MTHKKPPSVSTESDPFEALIKLIRILRGQNGCPWDRKQTPKSLSVYLTEEVFELTDAIASEDTGEICEELGDVLFQVFFVAGIYQERGSFDIRAVVRKNIQKMIRRHPHVFGSDTVDNTDQVRQRWHQIKQTEKNAKNSHDRSAIDSVPVNLPALLRAFRISERAARIGFDWPDTAGVVEKVEEEWTELKSAMHNKDSRQIEQEFGDLLFTLVNLARFLKIHPETSLAEAIAKFSQRFKNMEKLANANGQVINVLSPQQLNRLWEDVKGQEDRDTSDT